MDQKGRGRGRGGGGAGGRGGGDNSRTDLLAAGRKKLQQFRKKKDKKGPGKKVEADADEGASAAGANGEDAVPEPKSPVGLKFLAGEGGSSHSTPFEEAARVQEEQCNGQEPAAAEPSAAENADVAPVPEDADGGSVQNISSISEQGNSEHGSPGLVVDVEDSTVQATSSDVGGDPVGAQPGEVDGEELPDIIIKESTEPQISSQGDIAEDGSTKVGEHQEVQMDPVETANSSDFKEIREAPIPSQDSGACNTNTDEGAREMEVGVSGRPSDDSIKEDVEPAVSAEIGVEAGHEEAFAPVASHVISGRGDTDGEGVGKEAVQEDVGTSKTNATEEAVTAYELDLSVDEKVDPALVSGAVSQGFMPYHHEYIQRHLYVTTLSRDFLQLQLDEAAHLHSDEILKLQVLLKESQESKVAVCEEIQQCRNELSDMNTVKGELELTVASQKQEISTGNSKCEQLEIELQSSKENAQQILGELADCQSLLEALQKENMELTTNFALEKEARKEVEEQGEHLSGENKKLLSKLSDLELSLASVKEVMNAGSSRCESLELELCSSKENMEHTLTELANCRALLETSQKDYFELSANFAIETEANKKLKEDNVCLHNEKEKLSSDLSELNDMLHVSYAKHKQLESHVRDTETHMEQLKEQLIEESMHATNSFHIYQSVIKELDAKCNVVLDQAQTVVCQKNEHHPDSPEITVENIERTVPSPEKDSCKSTALRSLKGHLEVAKGELYELQKLVERISSRSDGRVLVSKLIQSFEVKGNQEEPGMSEGEHDGLKKLTQEMISCLVEKFKLMTSDLTETEKYVAELCDRIELSSKSDVEQEAERQRTAALGVKMDGLVEKLSNQKNTIDQLHIQLANVQQDADDHAGKLTDQAELLHNDVTERISILEKERASLSDLLSEVTNKLSSLSGTSPNDLGESEGLSFYILNSVDLAAKSIQSLQDKLEAGQTDSAKLNTSMLEIMKAHSDVQERNEHACRMVKSMYDSLQEFLRGSLGYSDEAGAGYDAEEPIEALVSHLGGTIEHLKNLLHDHRSLQSNNVSLESRLLSKCEEVEELSLRCSSLTENMNGICLQNEELKLVSSSKSAALDALHGRCLSVAEKMVQHSASPTSVVLSSMSSSGEAETLSKEHHILNTLLPCIEEGVASYNEKLENAVEETHLSKICLQNAHIFDQISFDKWSLPLPVLIEEEIVPKVCDLQGKIDQLSALNIQLETEAPVLRDGLKKLDEALEISRVELQKRSSELEQSEQKLSSVKEKLGIAVAKGKGLIVQRDGLKQSLSEKSGELEKLSQELQSKDALVKELEAKLKSYTEADRIEALESELSYIRNSATALRDSFILKDSVLQRIEEVLEDLDLPDHFHSRDIVEKIELLSKMAVGASFTMPDGDKRSSVDGHSESVAAMDSISDEQISNSNPVSDEMKNKYDELHRRFYELAEHNNMLEQSLVERNSIVQKWEEVLGQVSIPPQFRMLEPEDRIAWLVNRILEVEHERDTLRLKIEHLEDSSEMLITDLEESHKRISEFSAEVVAVKAEKEFFSQSLEKLRFEFLGLSEKAVQDEFVRDNLRKDLAELQEKLAEKANESKRYHDLEIEIHKLLDMVRNVLQDGSNTEIPSGDSGAVLCLGELLRKVLDQYETLLSESTLGNSAEKEIHLEEAKLSNDASTSETGRDDKESALNALSNELEHARRSLTLAEQQCDEAVEKAQSLTLEAEVLHAQINQLQEVGAEQTQKHQLLVLELESVGKQRDDLQEKLNQSSELEHAHSSLVLAEQQRDEAVEKSHSLILEVETAHAQINQLQEDRAEQTKRHESLVLELDLVGKQRDDLQEKLNQEEQKCTSLREKLNVAVRKGKGLVQQRDNLKQTIEETNAVIENLKNERKQHIESLESEKSLLMSRLSENEKSLHDTTQYLSRLLNALSMVQIAREFDTDPVTKVGKIAQLYLDLQATAASSQNELKKSKRATELLLAELNEAHERADNLQEELVMAEAALSESSKQNNVLESARADAVRHLEHITYMQAQAARKQIDHLKELNSTSGQLREVCFELSHRLVSAFSKDVDLICYMESFMKSSGKWMDGTNMVDIPITSNRLLSTSISSKKTLIPNAPLEFTVDDTDGSQILHHLAIACHAVSDCAKDCNDLKRNIDEHGFSIDQKATELSGIMSNLQSRFTSQNNELESLKENIVELQSEIKEKEEESLSLRRNMSLLYEACSTSVSEIGGMTGMGSGNRSYSVGQNHLSSDDHIKSLVEQLGAAVKTTRYSNEGNTKELKATVLELQQELQGKDVQISTISSELASQIRDAESYAKQLSVELEDARMEIHNLEKHVEMLLNQKKALETQVTELKDLETVASEQHGRIKELTDELSRKDQEIEGLMQALDEEEKELEILENKSNGLEQMLQEKEFALKSLEVSRTKTLTKLATTVDKFDELHSLSESLLVEVESLQSQLQERDSEISFLRQEVTRSTNELLTTEDSNKQYSSQINDFVKWLETALLQFGVHCESTDDHGCTQVPVYMDMLDKKIGSLISESDDLRIAVQSKDSSLQVERTKMEELSRKSEALEVSLSQKDSQIGLLRRDRISGQPSRSINLPGTSEIEQMNDKVSPTAVGTQIRGARKVNNDQVAIDVEMHKDKPLDDEDDDKAHGFKSLTMSRIVPKFTRPISDRVDGMWVSGDRLLMRQPTLRLGVLLYWIALHALLASFI